MKKNYFLTLPFWCLLFFVNSLQSQEFDGFAIYNEQNTTYVIDKNSDIAHTWSLPTQANYALALKDNGNLVRGAKLNATQLDGAAVGGLIQEWTPQGDLVWEFEYSSSAYVSHHDITLIGDNVLLTAWEVKTNAELQALGYTGNSAKWPTHFVEVAQNGTGGEIVWEWHMIDHMIQDTDPAKPNYGVVAEHPELMDINVPAASGGGGPGGGNGDWFHVNGVDYNPEKDLIAFSSRLLSEVFIIDHSTTTAEAASHEGGNAGKGGDFLYRWGNPSNYDTPGSQEIGGPVHDVRFIPNDGRPRGGFLQFFNNRAIGNNTSAVDAIELPYATDGYNFEKADGQPYTPSEATFRHICLDNASGQSASNSMPNGNVFVNLSMGYQYEIDMDGNVVWQNNAGPLKGFRYICDHPGVQVLIAQDVVSSDLCEIVNATEQVEENILQISPNPSSGIFDITGLPLDYQIKAIQVFDFMGKRILATRNAEAIDLSNQATGIYSVSIQLDNNQLITKKIALWK